MLHTSLIQLSLICSYLLKSFLKYKMYFLRVPRDSRFCYSEHGPEKFTGLSRNGLQITLGMQRGAMRGGYIVAVLQLCLHRKNDKNVFCHKSPFITNFIIFSYSPPLLIQ